MTSYHRLSRVTSLIIFVILLSFYCYFHQDCFIIDDLWLPNHTHLLSPNMCMHMHIYFLTNSCIRFYYMFTDLPVALLISTSNWYRNYANSQVLGCFINARYIARSFWLCKNVPIWLSIYLYLSYLLLIWSNWILPGQDIKAWYK